MSERVGVLKHIDNILRALCKDQNVKMESVSYGAYRGKQSENDSGKEKWNYFVFNRKKTKRSGTSNCDFQTYYQVHIVHEDFIPEGYVEHVIETLQSPCDDGIKLKVTDDDIEYDYTYKGNTNMVVEIATINFTSPEKRK